MVRSRDNLIFVESEMGFPDDSVFDGQCADRFTMTAPFHSSIDLLSAAPHYSLMRSAAPPPHPPTHNYL